MSRAARAEGVSTAERVCAVEVGDLLETEECLHRVRKNTIFLSDAASSRYTGISEQVTLLAYVSLFPLPFRFLPFNFISKDVCLTKFQGFFLVVSRFKIHITKSPTEMQPKREKKHK